MPMYEIGIRDRQSDEDYQWTRLSFDYRPNGIRCLREGTVETVQPIDLVVRGMELLRGWIFDESLEIRVRERRGSTWRTLLDV